MQTIWLFPPLLLCMASCYFLNADLNLNQAQHLNISLGWGAVYLEVSVEKPELVVITCTTLKCVLRHRFPVQPQTSHFILFSYIFFSLVLVHLPTSGNVVQFSKVSQSRPVSCVEEYCFEWCFTESKRCLCLGARCAKRRRRNKLGGEVICPYLHNRFVTRQGLGPKGFYLVGQILQPINQAPHNFFF